MHRASVCECRKCHEANPPAESRLCEFGYPAVPHVNAVMVVEPTRSENVLTREKLKHEAYLYESRHKSDARTFAYALTIVSIDPMKVKLSGNRVRIIRETLGMTVPQFASVIAVHAGTVHRWEAAGEGLVPIDGVAAGVVTALDQRLREREANGGAFNPGEVGQQVAQALIVGGALVALGLLIGELVGKGKR